MALVSLVDSCNYSPTFLSLSSICFSDSRPIRPASIILGVLVHARLGNPRSANIAMHSLTAPSEYLAVLVTDQSSDIVHQCHPTVAPHSDGSAVGEIEPRNQGSYIVMVFLAEYLPDSPWAWADMPDPLSAFIALQFKRFHFFRFSFHYRPSIGN